VKYIYIIRHAKSSWKEPGLKDQKRPLNKRGKHDGPKMADFLYNTIEDPIELVYSSHAVRAKTTASFFHKAFKVKDELDIRRDLYFGNDSDVMYTIHETPENYKVIALFGHNPLWTYFVNRFQKENFIDNLPTCGIAQLVSSADTWSSILPENTSVTNIYLPKQILY